MHQPPASAWRKPRTWPRLDSLWQSNRGTANNIFGQVLPQSVIPAMSGPVLPSASSGSVWGSATGALFSWEPFDFGLRQRRRRRVPKRRWLVRGPDEALTRLDVQMAVGAAFLDIVGAQRAVAALQADVDRREPPGPRGPYPRGQPVAAGGRGVADRRGTCRRAHATHPGPAGRHTGADYAGARARRNDGRRHHRSDDAGRSTSRPMRPRPLRRRIRSRWSVRRPSTSRAHRKTCCRGRIGHACIFSRVYSRVAAARTRTASSMAASRRPRSRPRQLGGRRAGGVSQRLRLLEPARSKGRGGRNGARRDGAATTKRC